MGPALYADLSPPAFLPNSYPLGVSYFPVSFLEFWGEESKSILLTIFDAHRVCSGIVPFVLLAVHIGFVAVLQLL